MAKEKDIRSQEGPLNPDFTADKAEARRVAPGDVPEGTVSDVIEWVSGDKARAKAALDTEKKSKDARGSLVNSLEKILNEETGAGIASGEA